MNRVLTACGIFGLVVGCSLVESSMDDCGLILGALVAFTGLACVAIVVKELYSNV